MTTQLSPTQFAAWRDGALPSTSTTLPVVLDVREPWELQTASVKPDGFTLLHITMRDIPARISELQQTLGTTHPIACLCHHGMRSLQVANFLKQGGFTEVVNLQGGIDAWSQFLDPSITRY